MDHSIINLSQHCFRLLQHAYQTIHQIMEHLPHWYHVSLQEQFTACKLNLEYYMNEFNKPVHEKWCDTIIFHLQTTMQYVDDIQTGNLSSFDHRLNNEEMQAAFSLTIEKIREEELDALLQVQLGQNGLQLCQINQVL